MLLPNIPEFPTPLSKVGSLDLSSWNFSNRASLFSRSSAETFSPTDFSLSLSSLEALLNGKSKINWFLIQNWPLIMHFKQKRLFVTAKNV